MSSSFKFIDHTADIAAEIFGNSLEELFEAAAEVWKISVADTEKCTTDNSKSLSLSAHSIEELLVDFLNELNFLLQTKNWLFLKIESVKIDKEMDNFILLAELKGASNISGVNIKQEIKSVTYHQLNIVEDENGFKTKIIFDI